jgi:hypothetical protein
MSLEKQIAEQYGNRANKDNLYAGIYSALALRERAQIMKALVSSRLRPGDAILEIGAGHGDNVPLLRECGFADEEIFLNEMLPERIVNIKTRYPDLRLYEGDALRAAFDRKFRWVFQSTVFTSVLGEADRRSLAKKMWELLEPGGHILWYDFIYNNPYNADVRGVPVSETRALFPDASAFKFRRITLAPPIGRRVGKLYPLFNLPFLRSHILAVIQKPQ